MPPLTLALLPVYYDVTIPGNCNKRPHHIAYFIHCPSLSRYFKCQLKDLDDSSIRWAFSRCLQAKSSIIWGFESQLHDFKNLPWNFSTQICDTMRKHRAFVKQITVSTVRWTFKTQVCCACRPLVNYNHAI